MTLFSVGDKVRVTEKSLCGDEDFDAASAKPGVYTVYDFLASNHKHNDDPLHKAYYMLDESGSYGGGHWAYPEHVVLETSKRDLDARTAPSQKEFQQAVAGGLMSAHDMDISMVSYRDDGGLDVEGELPNGLGIMFTVSFQDIEVYNPDGM